MANNEQRYNFTLAFNADTRSAKREMTSLVEEINKLTKNTLSRHISFGDVKEGAQQAAREVNKFSSILANAVNVDTGKLDLSKLNKSLKASNTDLTKMAKQFGALGNEGVKAFSNVVRQINAAEVPLRKTNAMVEKLWQSLKNTFTWQVSSSALNAFTGAISGAYTYAKNLNKSLNDIRIVTGYSADQMAKFAKEANKAARELSSTTQEYTKASLIYYQQGLNESEVAERTKITVQMAKVAGDSASEVSQQLTAVWNNFAKGGENLTKFADSMTALGAATASSTKEISDGLEKFASVADTVGLSFDYAAAALATITATTRASADTVGTSLKTLFARIQDLEMGKTLDDGTTLGKYSQTLKAVGIDIKGANGELKDMDDILSEMGAKWKTLAKDEQVALAQGVAGTREYAQLVALMDNWDFMKQNLETSKNAAGTLAEQAKIYEESWRAASDRVKAAAEGLFDDLINDEFFIDLLNGAEKLLDIVKSLVQSLGGVEGVLATISTYVLTIARTKIADELKRITGPSQKTKEMEAMNTKKEANEAFGEVLGKSGSQEDEIRANNYKRIYEIQKKIYGNAKDLTDEQIRTAQAELDQYQILTDILAEKAKIADENAKTAKEEERQLLRKERALKREREEAAKGNSEKQKQIDAANQAFRPRNPLNKLSSAFKQEDIDKVNAARKAVGLRELTDTQEKHLKAGEKNAETYKNGKNAYTETFAQIKKELEDKIEKLEDEIIQDLKIDAEELKPLLDNYKNLTNELEKAWQGLSVDDKDVASKLAGLSDKTKNDIVNATKGEFDNFDDFIKTIKEGGKEGQNALDTLREAIEAVRAENLEEISIKTGLDIEDVKKVTDAIDAEAEATVELTDKRERLNKVGKDVADGMDENLKVTASWQDAIVSAAGAVTSLVSAWQTLGGIWDTFNDPDLTAWEKITGIFMALGTAIPALVLAWKNLTDAKIKETIVTGLNTMASKANAKAKDNEGKSIKERIKSEYSDIKHGFKNKAKGVGGRFTGWKDTFYEKALETSDFEVKGELAVDKDGNLLTKEAAKQIAGKDAIKGLGKQVAGGLAVAAAVAIVTATVKTAIAQYKEASKDAQNAAEVAQQMQQEYQSAKAEYESFVSTIEEYNNLSKSMDELTKGTIEYNEALMKANDLAMELIKNNKDLIYTVENGQIIIDEASMKKAQEEKLASLGKQQANAALSSINASQMASDADRKTVARNINTLGDSGAYAKNTTVGALAGGAGTALAVAGIGATIGSAVPVLGTIIGGIVGLVVGGITAAVSTAATGVATNAEEQALEKIAKYYNENSSAKGMFVDDEEFKRVLKDEIKVNEKLIPALVKNRKTIEELTSVENARMEQESAEWKTAFNAYNQGNANYQTAENQTAIANLADQERKRLEEEGTVASEVSKLFDGSNDDFWQAWLKEVKGEENVVGTAGENWKVEDLGGKGVSLYQKNADGAWELIGEKDGLDETVAKNALIQARIMKLSSDKMGDFINQYSKLSDDLWSAGATDEEMIKSILNSFTKGEAIDLSKFAPEIVNQLIGTNVEDEGLQKALSIAIEEYNRNIPDWYNKLTTEEKKWAWKITVDKDASIEEVKSAIASMQAYVNQNELTTSIKVRNQIESAIESGDIEEAKRLFFGKKSDGGLELSQDDWIEFLSLGSKDEMIDWLRDKNEIDLERKKSSRQSDINTKKSNQEKLEGQLSNKQSELREEEDKLKQKRVEAENDSSTKRQKYYSEDEYWNTWRTDDYKSPRKAAAAVERDKLKDLTENELEVITYYLKYGYEPDDAQLPEGISWDGLSDWRTLMIEEMGYFHQGLMKEENWQQVYEEVDRWKNLYDDKKNAEEKTTEAWKEVNDQEQVVTNTKSAINSLSDSIKKEKEEIAKLLGETIFIDQEMISTLSKMGISEEEFSTYKTLLIQQGEISDHLNDLMTTNIDAYNTAIDNLVTETLRLNNGLTSLVENWEIWNEVMSSSNPTLWELQDILPGVQESLANILNFDLVDISQLPVSYFQKNWSLIQDIYNNVDGAIEKFRIKTTQQMFKELKIDDKALNIITQSLEKIPDYEIGVSIDDEAFIQQLEVLLNAGQITADKLNEILKLSHLKANYTSLGYTKVEVPENLTEGELRSGKYYHIDSEGKYSNYADSPSATDLGLRVRKGKNLYVKTGYDITGLERIDDAEDLVNIDELKEELNKNLKLTKKSDVIEPFKEVNDKIADMEREINRASKAADRLWGDARIKAIEKENNAIQQNIKLLKNKRAEAEYRTKEAKQDLISVVGSQYKNAFDKNGNFTGYDEVLEPLFARLNKAEKSGGATEDIQNEIDRVKDAISEYDSLNQTRKDMEDQILEAWYQWQDNNLEKINYKLEFEITIADSELELIDYYLEKSKNKFYGEMETYVSKLYEKVNIYGQETEEGDWTGKIASYKQNIAELLEARQTGAINTKQFEESLATLQTDTISNIQTLNELKETLTNVYGDTLNKMGEEVGIFTSKMKDLNSVLDHYSNILDLVGKKDDFDAKGLILSTKANNIRSQLDVNKEFYNSNVEAKQNYFNLMNNAKIGSEEYEFYKAQWEAVSKVVDEKQAEILEGTKEWAEAIKAEIENEFAKLADIMEDSLTGGLSFDEIETSMERRESLQEEYLTTTNQIYETTKLMRTAQKAIDESQDSIAKKKLNNFVKETKQLQNQGKLSKYELEIQQAKYDLLLAEIALNEAQNAKSVVRLQRDSEGNFGYVYTADQNEIADAQQRFDDANNALYNKGLEGMNSYTQKYYETQREFQDAITELTLMWTNGEITSWEEFERRRVELYDYYSQKLQQYSELQSVALSAHTEVIQDAWTTSFYESQVSVDEWKIAVNTYFNQAEEGLNKWKDTCATVLKESNLEDLEKATGDVAAENEKLVKVLMGENGKGGLINALQSEIDNIDELVGTDGAYTDWIGGIDSVIDEYEKLFDAIESAKAAAAGLPELPEGWNEGGNFNAGDYSKGYVKYAKQGTSGEVKVYRGNSTFNDDYIIQSGGEYVSTGQTKKMNGKLYYQVNAIQKGSGSEGLGYVDEDTYNRLFYGYVDKNQELKSQKDKVWVAFSEEDYFTNPKGKDISINTIDFSSIRYDEKHKVYTARTKSGAYIHFEDAVYRQLMSTLSSFDTGGYTGDWGPEGKLAMLHQKELVLNQQDTSNLLAAVDMLRTILNTIDIHALNSQLGGILTSPSFHHDTSNVLEQNVKIEASFPGMTNRYELEEAFNNLINKASQYANRK